MRARGFLVAGLVAVLALSSAGTAAAQDVPAPPPRIDVQTVGVTAGRARVVLGTADVPPGAEPGLRVTVDGTPVPATATALDPRGPAAKPPPRAVVMLLDTSGSMGESGIAAARTAARAYLRDLPSDVLVGLVTFASTAQLLVPPNTQRAPLLAALDRVRAGGNTALYDAVDTAVGALDAARLGPTAQFRLLLLSDGVDNVSVAPLVAARAKLADGHVATDVVAFRYGDTDSGALDDLAGAAGGRVLAADDTAALAGAFETIARTFYQRVEVQIDVPAELAGHTSTLEITLAGATTTRTVTFAAVPAPPWILYLVLATLFAAMLTGALLLLGRRDGSTDRARLLVERIGRYSARPGEPGGRDGVVAVSAVGQVARLLARTGIDQRLATRLDHAGIRRSAAEWALLCTCAAVVLAAVVTLLTGSVVAGVLIGTALGWLGMRVQVDVRTGRRRAAFAEQLPDVLQLVAGSLQSGFSLAQALDTVVRQDTQPSSGEISRALAETRIGVDLETALDRVADRMDCGDLRWVVMAIRIQREVGGNLAEVLLTTVGTIRERAQLHRQVRALSAEGRLSAYILVGLPIAVGGFLFLTRGEYVRPLYTTGIGIVMLGGAVVSVVIGALWMRVLVKVEV